MNDAELLKQFNVQTSELRHACADLSAWHASLLNVVRRLDAVFRAGGRVFVCGNGGSAALAQHFSDEMVGRYRADRAPLAVIALTADSAVLTCIGNDYGFEEVFARQLTALGRPGDLLVAYSTSGASPNILRAAETAHALQMTVIAMTGASGRLRDLADLVVVSPGTNAARMQEFDLHALHLICEAFEPRQASP